MYVVAVTRWSGPVEEAATTLAPLLGATVYDLRLTLNGPLPVVLHRQCEDEQAKSLLSTLHSRGHGAVACENAQIPSAETMTTPRTFSLGDRALSAEEPGSGHVEIAYDEILALVRATVSGDESTTTVTNEKKFSLGRAALTGGLIRSTKVTREERSRSDLCEQVLYLIRRTGRDPIILREQRLKYGGLGDRIGRTTTENFATLSTMLVERTPGALHDDRLVAHARKASALSISRLSSDSVTSTSNASETDLAAHVLAVAHLRGQL